MIGICRQHHRRRVLSQKMLLKLNLKFSSTNLRFSNILNVSGHKGAARHGFFLLLLLLVDVVFEGAYWQGTSVGPPELRESYQTWLVETLQSYDTMNIEGT